MWPKNMLKRIPHLIQQHEKEYNTIQYFIDTPLVGLFSVNATNKHTYKKI